MPKILFFSEAEKAYIRENYAHSTANKIAEVLNRNPFSIKRFVKQAGLCGKSRKRIWTDEKLEKLKALFPVTTNAELAIIFGTTNKAVQQAGHNYKLYKTEEHIAAHRKGQFDGSRPVWNKGMKGLLIPGSEKGFFKKGNLPHNTKQDGAISIRNDQSGRPYRFVRVKIGVWVHESVVIYEAAHGKIPKNMVVRHINGDTLDNSIENLELITKTENMARNTIHQYPEELQSTIRALGKLNKTLRNHGSKE